MANIPVNGLCCPLPPHLSTNPPSFVDFTIDSSTKKAAVIFVVPKTGNIERCEYHVTANSVGTFRASFQDVDPTTGNPDGGVDQFRTYVNQQSSGWTGLSAITHDGTDSGSRRSVTRGQILALVWDFTSYTSGNVTIRFLGGEPALSFTGNFPYVTTTTSGGSWNKIERYPVIALRYTDGTYEYVNGTWPCSALSTVSFNQTSNPDERGMIFQVPLAMSVSGFWFLGNFSSAGALNVVLYDTNSNILTSLTLDTDQSVAGQVHRGVFPTSPTLQPNSDYRITIKPTTDTNINLSHFNVFSTDIMKIVPGSGTWQLTTRTDNGSWTNTSISRPWMGLFFDGVYEQNVRIRSNLSASSTVSAEIPTFEHFVECNILCVATVQETITLHATTAANALLSTEITITHSAQSAMAVNSSVTAAVAATILNAQITAETAVSAAVGLGLFTTTEQSAESIFIADAHRTVFIESSIVAETNVTSELFAIFDVSSDQQAESTLSAEFPDIHSIVSSMVSVSEFTVEAIVDAFPEATIVADVTVSTIDDVLHPVEATIENESTVSATEDIDRNVSTTIECETELTAVAIKLHVVESTIESATIVTAVAIADYILEAELENEPEFVCDSNLAIGLTSSIFTETVFESDTETSYEPASSIKTRATHTGNCFAEYAISSTILSVAECQVSWMRPVVTRLATAELESEVSMTADLSVERYVSSQFVTETTTTSQADIDFLVVSDLIASNVLVDAKMVDVEIKATTVLSAVAKSTYHTIVAISSESATTAVATIDFTVESILSNRVRLIGDIVVEYQPDVLIEIESTVKYSFGNFLILPVVAEMEVETTITGEISEIVRGIASTMNSLSSFEIIPPADYLCTANLRARVTSRFEATKERHPEAAFIAESIIFADADRIQNISAELECEVRGIFTLIPLLGEVEITAESSFSSNARSHYFPQGVVKNLVTVFPTVTRVQYVETTIECSSTLSDAKTAETEMVANSQFVVVELIDKILECELSTESLFIAAHFTEVSIETETLFSAECIIHHGATVNIASNITVAPIHENIYFCTVMIRSAPTVVFGLHTAHWLDEQWLSEELALLSFERHWDDQHWIDDLVISPLFHFGILLPTIKIRCQFRISGDVVEPCPSKYRCIDRELGIVTCVSARRVKSRFNKFEADKITDALAPVNSICVLSIDEEKQQKPKVIRKTLNQNILGALNVIPLGPNTTAVPTDVSPKTTKRKKTRQMCELEAQGTRKYEDRQYTNKKWSNLDAIAAQKRLQNTSK
jgi:hypothetical protein